MAQSQAPPLAEPELIPVKGGWMARSAEGSKLRIAVVGETRDEATARFADELAAWARLREDGSDG